MTIQMKVTDQYFLVLLFIMLYKVILTFVSVERVKNIRRCNSEERKY